MSLIIYTGLDGLLSTVQQKLTTTPFEVKDARDKEDNESFPSADVFLVGPYEDNPVKTVQLVTAKDRHISILVLTLPAQFQSIKQNIQFAPFVGKNVVCVAYTESLDLPATLSNAASRTRQRRSFSKLNKVPKGVVSIAASAVKVQDFGIFLEQAPIGALLIDSQDGVLAINAKAKQLFGADEQKHYELKDFFPAHSLPQLKLRLSDPSQSNVLEVNSLFLELQLSEVKNEEGKSLHILLINDITQQKKKERALVESEALFRFMADAMPQKVWTADEKGERNFFNLQWIQYSGLDPSQLYGWNWTTVIHPDDREANLSAWKGAIASGNDFQFEHRLRRKDGVYRWHLVRGIARKDPNGKVQMWIGTNTDIHEQKEFAEEMERKVRDRTSELEKSNSELEQFVYVTSHDLQEPLRKIRIFSEMLKSAVTGLEPAPQRYLDKVSATALRMSTLLKELLNFTQMSKNEQFEKTDLNEIVAKALVDLELVISEKGAIVTADLLPVLDAAPVQMHQLFYNLISNALKFCEPHHKPLVHILCRTADPQQLTGIPTIDHDKMYYEIVVQDNGIGFDQTYADQIFHIFKRLHNRTEYTGTGIGLALCKRVVTNHQGSIYALSKKGEGAAFHILLPLAIS